MDRITRLLIAAAVAALAIGLAACGGSDDSTSSSSSGGTSGSGESEQTSFTYGYAIPTGQNPWIGAIAETAQADADAAGGEGELTDAQLDTANQVAQVNRFVSQGDDVAVAAPANVPESLEATFSKAVGAGTAALAMEWSFTPGDPEAPPEPPVQGQATIDREKLGQEVAEAIAEAHPEGTEVIYVGLPFPVASIDFFQESMEGKLGKSKLVANLDNPSDNAQGALGPLSGALAANPNAGAIVTYNGPSALAAVQAVKSAGLTGKVDIYNIQLDAATAKALEQGQIAACWDINPIELGDALGELIAAAGTGKPESEWAKTVTVAPTKYTKENIGSWEDWAAGG